MKCKILAKSCKAKYGITSITISFVIGSHFFQRILPKFSQIKKPVPLRNECLPNRPLKALKVFGPAWIYVSSDSVFSFCTAFKKVEKIFNPLPSKTSEFIRGRWGSGGGAPLHL
jgi:hypothetical protein